MCESVLIEFCKTDSNNNQFKIKQYVYNDKYFDTINNFNTYPNNLNNNIKYVYIDTYEYISITKEASIIIRIKL